MEAKRRTRQVLIYRGWYVVKGGLIVNYSPDLVPIENAPRPLDIEALRDTDVFTWNQPIWSMAELIKAVKY